LRKECAYFDKKLEKKLRKAEEVQQLVEFLQDDDSDSSSSDSDSDEEEASKKPEETTE